LDEFLAFWAAAIAILDPGGFRSIEEVPINETLDLHEHPVSFSEGNYGALIFGI